MTDPSDAPWSIETPKSLRANRSAYYPRDQPVIICLLYRPVVSDIYSSHYIIKTPNST